jgi:uncharacterized YigZ family protein
MQNTDFYFTIAQNATAEFKDRGSKFIAFAYPVETIEAAKQHLLLLKKEHAKANHFCFAYRIGTEGLIFRSTDDGEPSGSAGKPILGQIDSKGLYNVLVVVVRYFGGTLLGVPGLINAYKTSAALCLQMVPIIKKNIELPFKLEFDYTKLNEVLLLLKQNSCTIYKQELQLFCTITFGVQRFNIASIEKQLQQLNNTQLTKL